MELDSDAERYWAYYVPQTLPEDAPDHAPTSIRDVKILDPAVGSGHFLVIAFELLVALYDEEAGHRGEKGQEQWSEKKVAECILENNLHGIDLDPRAIQIAAAALWLKARETCPKARPHHLNLVASDLRLASLPTNDPALKELREAIKRDTGIPHELTDEIIEGLKGADHLGSLLRVAHTVEDAIKAYEDPAARKDEPDGQGSFLPTFAEEAKRNILERLETFLKAHTSGDDLGLRLRGEQLATGVRFLRMTREGTYDLVVGNPPYQDTSDISDAGNLERQFPDAGTDLFSMFITRAVELVVQGGWAAMVTKQDWLYLHRFRHLRRHLECRHIFAIANLGAGAFAQIGGEVVQAVAFSLRASSESAADLAMTVVDASEGLDSREKAAMLHVAEPSRRYPAAYRNIDGAPLVLAWDNAFVSWYASTSKLGQECAVKQGLATGDNIRFLRSPNEIHPMRRQFVKFEDYGASEVDVIMAPWVPYIKGAKGLEWFEPGTHAIRWAPAGLQINCSNAMENLHPVRRTKNFILSRE
ncbi:Eco57I restriction-modification methylase domain-containing protein [Nannocystis pusilla]